MFAIQTNKTLTQEGEWEYWVGPDLEPDTFATEKLAQDQIDLWFCGLNDLKEMFPEGHFPSLENLRIVPYTKEVTNDRRRH